MDRELIKEKLQEFSDLITSIQTIVSETPNDVDWMYVDLPVTQEDNKDTTVDKLYTVVEYYKENSSSDCEICGGTGLVSLDDTFRHHYKRCECRKLNKSYCVHIVPVDYYDTDNLVYVCKDKRIPSTSVHDYFNEALAEKVRQGYNVFFETQEDSERCLEALLK